MADGALMDQLEFSRLSQADKWRAYRDASDVEEKLQKALKILALEHQRLILHILRADPCADLHRIMSEDV